MTLAAAILAVLVGLPAPACPPRATCASPAVRAEHLRRVAYAIASASERATWTGPWAAADATIGRRVWPGSAEELAAVLVTTGYWESRFSVAVQAGRCLESGCGPRWRLAHSDWQIEQSAAVSPALWRSLRGLGEVPISDAAWTSARLLALSRGHCAAHARDWVEPTLSGYAIGSACSWSGAARRVPMVWSVLYRLRRLR